MLENNINSKSISNQSIKDEINLNLFFLKSDRDLIYDFLEYLTEVLNGAEIDNNDEIIEIRKFLKELIIRLSELKIINIFVNNYKSEYNELFELSYFELTWHFRSYLTDLLMKNSLFFNDIYNLENNYNNDYNEFRLDLIDENQKICYFLEEELEMKKYSNYDKNLFKEQIKQKLDCNNNNQLEKLQTISELDELLILDETEQKLNNNHQIKINNQQINEQKEIDNKLIDEQQIKTIEQQQIDDQQIENQELKINKESNGHKEKKINSQPINEQTETDNKLIDEQQIKTTEQQIDDQQIENQELKINEESNGHQETKINKQSINKQPINEKTETDNKLIDEQQIKTTEQQIDDQQIENQELKINEESNGHKEKKINNQPINEQTETDEQQIKTIEQQIDDQQIETQVLKINEESNDNQEIKEQPIDDLTISGSECNELIIKNEEIHEQSNDDYDVETPDEPNLNSIVDALINRQSEKAIEQFIRDLVNKRLKKIKKQIFHLKKDIHQNNINIDNKIARVDITNSRVLVSYTITNIRQFFKSSKKRASQIFYCRGIPWFLIASVTKVPLMKEGDSKIEEGQSLNYLSLKLVPNFKDAFGNKWQILTSFRFFIENTKTNEIYSKDIVHTFKHSDPSIKKGYGCEFIEEGNLFNNYHRFVTVYGYKRWDLTIHLDLRANKLVKF